MMKRIAIWTAIYAVGNAMVQTLHAALITGSVSFSGPVFLNGSSPVTATGVMSWGRVTATAATGNMADIIVGSPVIFLMRSWNFNTSTPRTNFWTAAGFHFELQSSSIIDQGGKAGVNGYVTVVGTGILSHVNFTPTKFRWTLSLKDPPLQGAPEWTFSSTSTSSNTNGEPVLTGRTVEDKSVFTWTDSTFTLQTTTDWSGVFTNVPGATSPYTNTFLDSPRFFRLAQ